jgi:hypothetical protein
MGRSFFAVLSLSTVILAGACSQVDQAQTAAPSPAPEHAETPAVLTGAADAPDLPQPVVVVPPKPKPGAPHGPGFDMPVIELGGYAPSRPMEVLRDAHVFTADHPEIASYVPCYCGCGSAGHKNNADCFVKTRDAQGRVAEWDPHGVACAVCIDIAVDSMKMHNSGASASAIRAKVQGDYRPRYAESETPTPAPPPKR